MATSSGDPKRSSVHDWCHSSSAAYATAISTAWPSAANGSGDGAARWAKARQDRIDRIAYSAKCAILRTTSWTVAIDSAEISGTNHFKNGPIKREVCAPENRSVEKKKMTPIHATTHTHGLIFGLPGKVLIVLAWKTQGSLGAQRFARKNAAAFSAGSTAGLSKATACHGALTPGAVWSSPSNVIVRVPSALRTMPSAGEPGLTT